MIIKNIFNILLPILFSTLLLFQNPALALEHSSDFRLTLSDSTLIAALKYEAKEPTSLENPVTDPNFNVMRKKELGKTKAIPLVVGVLIIAIAAPIATWMYFSN